MSTTIRSRIPVLISECLERGITVSIVPTSRRPFVELGCRQTKTEARVDIDFKEGVYGANAIYIERALIQAMEYIEEERRSGAV